MATFTDTFDSAGTDLTWANARGNTRPVTNGDGTASISGSAWQYARAEHNTGSADMFAETRIDTANAGGGPDRRAVLFVRASTGASSDSTAAVTLIAAVLSITNRTVSFIQMEGSPAPVGGSPLAGDQPVTVPSVPFTFRFEAQGGTVRAYFDGALVSEAAIRGAGPTGTFGGLGARDLGAAYMRHGEYRVGALGDPVPSVPTVDAGADARMMLGATFTRTATETGSPGLRSWRIQAGPDDAGTTISTAPALSWTPSVAGTYVLRYSATNDVGTGSDDVTVTVLDPDLGDVRVNLSDSPFYAEGAGQWWGPTGSVRATDLTGMDRTTGLRTTGPGGITTDRWPIAEGATYVTSVQVKPAFTGELTATISCYSAEGWLSAVSSEPVPVTAGQVVRLSASGTAPAGAVESVMAVDGATGAADYTAHLVEYGSAVRPYFDGDTPGGSWDGTPGASTSRIAAGPDTAAERHGWGDPLEVSDEFIVAGAPDPAKWSVYGAGGDVGGDECWVGHDGNGRRCVANANVVTEGGETFLRIHGEANGDTTGISHRYDVQYGRWEARARIAADTPGDTSGRPYHAVLIIWPTSNRWPVDGEYDWLEVDQGDTRASAWLHYPHPVHPDGTIEQAGVSGPAVDLTQFHNYGFEWVHGRLRGYLDGDQWFDLDGSALSSNGRRLDSMPGGHLTIQLDNFIGDTGLRPAHMDVEWARVYTVADSTPVGFARGTSELELAETAEATKTGRQTADGPLLLEGVAASGRTASVTATARMPLDADAGTGRVLSVAARSELALDAETATGQTRSVAVRSTLGLDGDAELERTITVAGRSELALGQAVTSRAVRSVAGRGPLLVSGGVTTAKGTARSAVSALLLEGRTGSEVIRTARPRSGLGLAAEADRSKTTGTATRSPLHLDAEALTSEQQLARARAVLALGGRAVTTRSGAVSAAAALTLAGRAEGTRTTSTAAEAVLRLAESAVTSRSASVAGVSPLALRGAVTSERFLAVTARSALELGAGVASTKAARITSVRALVLDAVAETLRVSSVGTVAPLLLDGRAETGSVASVAASSALLLDTDLLSGSGTQASGRSAVLLAGRAVTGKAAHLEPGSALLLTARSATVTRTAPVTAESVLHLAERVGLAGLRSVLGASPLRLGAEADAGLPPALFPPLLGTPVSVPLVVLGRPRLDPWVVVGEPRT